MQQKPTDTTEEMSTKHFYLRFVCYVGMHLLTTTYIIGVRWWVDQVGPFEQRNAGPCLHSAWSVVPLSFGFFFPVSESYVMTSLAAAFITNVMRLLIGEDYASAIISAPALALQTALLGKLLLCLQLTFSADVKGWGSALSTKTIRSFTLITQAYTVMAMLSDQPILASLTCQVLPILLNELAGGIVCYRVENLRRRRLTSLPPQENSWINLIWLALRKALFRCTPLLGWNRLNQCWLSSAAIPENKRLEPLLKVYNFSYALLVVGLLSVNIASIVRYAMTGNAIPFTVMNVLKINHLKPFVRPIVGDIAQRWVAVLHGTSASTALEFVSYVLPFLPCIWTAKLSWDFWRRSSGGMPAMERGLLFSAGSHA